jgi:hypothetical protein
MVSGKHPARTSVTVSLATPAAHATHQTRKPNLMGSMSAGFLLDTGYQLPVAGVGSMRTKWLFRTVGHMLQDTKWAACPDNTVRPGIQGC